MNYNELKISKENRNKELKSFEQIKNCINEEKSWIFDSGAGAGKTYALIETLKYIIIKKEKELKYNNQKVICITYTNVAVDEIKQRLGKTQLVNVSTIHEYIWETIRPYKKLLVDYHKECLQKEVEESKSKLSKIDVYNELNQDEKNNLKELLISNIKEYYQIKNLQRDEFICEIKKIGITNERLISVKKSLMILHDV